MEMIQNRYQLKSEQSPNVQLSGIVVTKHRDFTAMLRVKSS